MLDGPLQPGDPPRVGLHRPNLGPGPGQGEGEGAGTGAEVDHEVARRQAQPGYEAADQAVIDEEVLAELPPSVRLRGAAPAALSPGHGASPSACSWSGS